MKRTLLSLLAATTLVAGVPAVASAQSWMTINQRQAQLDQRIDAGVRGGQLTPPEAARLRTDFADLVRLEARYRQNGLTPSERADLDRRFDALSARIRDERRDGQRTDGRYDNRDGRYDRDGRSDNRESRWENLNRRQAVFQQRLDRAVRDGRVSRREAASLRREFSDIARLEQQYRRGGLNPRERADLDRRFDRLQADFRASVSSTEYGYGYNEAPNLFDWLFGVR